MTTIDGARRTEIDQVATWFTNEPPPRLVAALSFRAGLVDQRLTQAGWIPLLLEMALRVELPAYLELSAQVTLTTTTLGLAGPPHEVGTWLGRLTSRIARPHATDFASCVEAARTESRPAGALAEAAYWRYGFVGPGVPWFDPALGPWTATIEELTALASALFTRSNAVLALDGPPPTTLSLVLPEGSGRLAVPTWEPIIPLPASYPRGADSLQLTGTTPRATSARIATQIVGQRVTDRLRHGEGISYSPQSEYVPIGNQAILGLGVDVQPGAGQRAVDVVAEVIDDLSATGPTATEVDEWRLAALRSMTDPRAARAHPFRLAEEELLGRPLVTAAWLQQEVEAVGAADIATDVAAWHATGLLGLPKDTEAPAGFPLTPVDFTDPPPADSAARHAQHAGKEILQRTVDAVHSTVGDGGITIAYRDAIAYLAWADGRRELLDREGRRFIVEPRLWVDGRDLVRAMDEAVDPTIVVRFPARPPEELPQAAELAKLDRSITRTSSAVRALWVIASFVLLWMTGFQLIALTDPDSPGEDVSWQFFALGAGFAAVVALPTPFLVRRLSRLRQQRAAIG